MGVKKHKDRTKERGGVCGEKEREKEKKRSEHTNTHTHKKRQAARSKKNEQVKKSCIFVRRLLLLAVAAVVAQHSVIMVFRARALILFLARLVGVVGHHQTVADPQPEKAPVDVQSQKGNQHAIRLVIPVGAQAVGHPARVIAADEVGATDQRGVDHLPKRRERETQCQKDTKAGKKKRKKQPKTATVRP